MKIKIYNARIGEKCASYDCNGKLVERDNLSLKCSKCGMEYWKSELFDNKPGRKN